MVDSLDEIWEGDLLDRRIDAQILQDFLIRRHAERAQSGETGAYVVNLNAGWGHGKSFFMERFRRQIEAAGYLTAFVNAWRDDSSKEPVIAVMAAIEASLKPHFRTANAGAKIWAAAKANSAPIVATLAKGVAKKAVSKVAGTALEEIGDLIADQSLIPDEVEKAFAAQADTKIDKAADGVSTLLTKYIDSKITEYQNRVTGAAQFQARMRSLLSKLSERGDAKAPFFVLIDELDRCRPTYAIEMLEQVKHLFDIDNTIFIIATDGEQLSHSIKAVYGEGFDGKRYLLRFFQRHYKLESRDTAAFARYLFARNQIDMNKISTPFGSDPGQVFASAMVGYDVTLRDAEQCFDILRTITTVWDYPVPIELIVILPLIIRYQRHDTDSMKTFFDGNGLADKEIKNWRAHTNTQSRRARQAETNNHVSLTSLASVLITQAKKPLVEMYNFSASNDTSLYVSNVLMGEINSIHQGRISSDMTSVILMYPAIVRRLGKLTDTGEAT